MELGPILRSMLTNRVRVILLVLEIAVTMTIVLNCLNMIVEQRERVMTPTGLDEANILGIQGSAWGEELEKNDLVAQVIDRDLATLRSMPGVIEASAINPFPLQGGGSSFQLKPLGAPPSALVRSPVYRADERFIDTLGLELVAGRAFSTSDIPQERGPQIMNVIVTQDLADALFPDGDALGKPVDTGSEEYPDVIVGILRHMHTPYGGGPMESRITFYPGNPKLFGAMQYMVRTEPEAFDSVFSQVEEALLAVNPERILRVRSLLEIKGGGYLQNRFIAAILSVVMALLLLVTVMGIFGMASFSVTQRTKQIGTRRALGGTKAAIVRYFLVEISVIAVIGMVLGLVGAYALNIALVTNVEGRPLPAGLAAAGVVVLWLVALAATALPARRAAAVPPAVATRTV
jgi:putative ABC transport system permease protein